MLILERRPIGQLMRLFCVVAVLSIAGLCSAVFGCPCDTPAPYYYDAISPSDPCPGETVTATPMKITYGPSCDPENPNVISNLPTGSPKQRTATAAECVKISSISGPTIVNVNTDATFTAFTSTSTDKIPYWGGGYYGSSYTTRWTTGGKKTVTASLCGGAVSKQIDVIVLIPCDGNCCCDTCTLTTPCEWYNPDSGLCCQKVN